MILRAKNSVSAGNPRDRYEMDRIGGSFATQSKILTGGPLEIASTLMASCEILIPIANATVSTQRAGDLE
ncbi:MAG: hypothetical protein O7A65_07730 [Proteobacteria bacterium]|nr:hypothetical protein [Pseudomonadota bacterium]